MRSRLETLLLFLYLDFAKPFLSYQHTGRPPCVNQALFDVYFIALYYHDSALYQKHTYFYRVTQSGRIPSLDSKRCRLTELIYVLQNLSALAIYLRYICSSYTLEQDFLLT